MMSRFHRFAVMDALPATELRARVTSAIERHIPQTEWAQLKLIEAAEKETFNTLMDGLTQAG
ncbi:MAG: hypothetical protein QGG71_08820 [Pirellulaceae bacterium]|nr:hypothetical protein [Pirellulaceae bacterium]